MTKIVLPASDDELLRQCEVQTFRASGSGGQHVNKTDSAVRLVYLPYKISVSSQQERSQYLNKMRCIEKLREKVKQLNYRKPKRIPTKMPKARKEENLNKKSKHSQKKQYRKKISLD